MSVLLRPTAPPSRLGGLALLSGVAAREALTSLGARGIDLYWPNDLEHQGRKLGGILGEARRPGAAAAPVSPPAPDGSCPPPASSHPPIVALGLGLNIDLSGAPVPPALRGEVSSIAEAGCLERDPETIAVRILERLLPLYQALESGASIPVLVGGALSGIGRTVRVRGTAARPWLGRTLGIGEDGELLVRRLEDPSGSMDGVEHVYAAEVDYDQ
jgi:biotin-(acetyl-CoA carboxylase) ligase